MSDQIQAAEGTQTEAGEISPWPSIVGAAINLVIAWFLLEAQKDLAERMKPLGELAVEKAEELFDSHMDLRSWDQIVYDKMKGIECEPRCDTNEERGKLGGHFAPAGILQRTAFGHGRYNCGDRSAAIKDALSVGLISSGEGLAQAGTYEDLIVEACEKLRWTSIATSAAFGEFNGSSSFASVADQMGRLARSYGAGAAGALAAFSYSTAEAFERAFAPQRGAVNLPADGLGNVHP